MPMITRPEVASRITNAVDAMDETIKEIRATIFALQARDSASGPDLRGDIVALVEEMAGMLGFAPSLRLGAGLGAQVGPEVAEQVLAALREALSNAARHASASQVDVTVDVDPDGMLAVQVTDDGIGIPAEGRRSGLRQPGQAGREAGRRAPARPRPTRARPGRVPGWNGGYRPAEEASDGQVRGPGGLAGHVLAAVRAQVPAGQDLRRDPDEVVPRPGSPGAEADRLQPGDLLGIGHLTRRPDGGHAPAGLVLQVQAIGLERDHGTAGGGGELAAAGRSAGRCHRSRRRS